MAVAADIERATDSTTDWVAEHVQQYVASGGTEGHDWRGVPTLVLATTGARTGEPRRTGLIYGTSGDDLVVVASVGGARRTRSGTGTCWPSRRPASSSAPAS